MPVDHCSYFSLGHLVWAVYVPVSHCWLYSPNEGFCHEQMAAALLFHHLKAVWQPLYYLLLLLSGSLLYVGTHSGHVCTFWLQQDLHVTDDCNANAQVGVWVDKFAVAHCSILWSRSPVPSSTHLQAP